MSFEYQILTELPNSEVPRYYPSGGTVGGGDGLIVKVVFGNTKWVGIFSFGDYSSPSDVFGWNDSNTIFVVASGNGYFVDVSKPDKCSEVPLSPITTVSKLPNGDVFMTSFTDSALYNADGLVWETERISLDGIEVLNVSNEVIEGKSRCPGSIEWIPFSIDVKTGICKGGYQE